MENCYYHAGAAFGPGAPGQAPEGPGLTIRWSQSTRRTLRAAAREAIRIAGGTGWPMVEYWRRERGLVPADANAVIDTLEGPEVWAVFEREGMI
jgi:hypothetical protein